jgi:hypothetical protein
MNVQFFSRAATIWFGQSAAAGEIKRPDRAVSSRFFARPVFVRG